MNWLSRSLVTTIFLAPFVASQGQAVLAVEPDAAGNLTAAIKSKSINDQQFDQLTKFIQPSASEDKWRETPWIPSIRDGRKMSVAMNKPIFLWAMNGDPLGCV